MWRPPNVPYLKIWFLDKDGWPVETVRGHPIQNFIRLLLHTKKITTHWKMKVTWLHGTVTWTKEEIEEAYRELREKDPIGPLDPGSFEGDLNSASQNMNMGGAASI